MSAFNEIDVECEACGKEFKGTVWTAINARQDPELKDLLLGGELNILFCPECSHTFFYEHFLLYLDPDLKLAAYVYPPSEESQKDELEMLMKKGFAEAQEVFAEKDRILSEPVLLFGLDELQRTVRELDQRHLTDEVTKAKKEGTP